MLLVGIENLNQNSDDKKFVLNLKEIHDDLECLADDTFFMNSDLNSLCDVVVERGKMVDHVVFDVHLPLKKDTRKPISDNISGRYISQLRNMYNERLKGAVA